MKLEHELGLIGCRLDEATFVDKLADMFNGMHRGISVDEFLCRHWDVAEFCAIFCHKHKIPSTHDSHSLICRTLLSQRKRGNASFKLPRHETNGGLFPRTS